MTNDEDKHGQRSPRHRGAGKRPSNKLRSGAVCAGFNRCRSWAKEEACAKAARVELLPVEKDSITAGDDQVLAMIAAWVGDNDFACES